MLFGSDDDDFPVKCSNCKNEFHEKVGRLKTGQGTRCTDAACGATLKLTAEQFGWMVADARQSPHDFMRNFTRLRLPD